ncbi:hypothetical protein PMAYCL1PPCAC_13348, partial [Pristionchus mayeri]
DNSSDVRKEDGKESLASFEQLTLNDTSPLEELPRELAWQIIEKVPESILNLRATSRPMRAHADGFALETPKFPVFERMILMSSSDFPPDISICLCGSRLSKLFALGCKLLYNDPVTQMLLKYERDPQNPSGYVYQMNWYMNEDVVDEYMKAFLKHQGPSVSHDEIADYLSRRIGKRIEKNI